MRLQVSTNNFSRINSLMHLLHFLGDLGVCEPDMGAFSGIKNVKLDDMNKYVRRLK